MESFSNELFTININERKLTYIILIVAQILNGVGSQALLIKGLKLSNLWRSYNLSFTGFWHSEIAMIRIRLLKNLSNFKFLSSLKIWSSSTQGWCQITSKYHSRISLYPDFILLDDLYILQDFVIWHLCSPELPNFGVRLQWK